MKKLFGLLFILVGVLIIWKIFIPLRPVSGEVSSGVKSNTVSISRIQTISVHGKAVNVKVLTTPQNKMKANLKGNGNLTISRSGKEVKIDVHSRWVDWIPVGKQTKLVLLIPESYKKNLKLDMPAGNINMNGSTSKSKPVSFSKVSINLSAGDVKMQEFNVGTFIEKGSAGDVQMDRVKTISADFHLSAGKLALNHFSGKLKTNVSAGQVRVQMDKLAGPVDINVSAGNVFLDLPDHANAKLNAKVSKGNINCNLPLKNEEVHKANQLKGIHGSGKYSVNLNASFGDINVN